MEAERRELKDDIKKCIEAVDLEKTQLNIDIERLKMENKELKQENNKLKKRVADLEKWAKNGGGLTHDISE